MAGERTRAHAASGLSRRSFLTGAGAATTAAAAFDAALSSVAQAAADAEESQISGPGAVAVALRVNGVLRTASIEPRMTLAEVLRGPLALTGAKVACDQGACSACTVLIDGTPIASCSILAVDVGDRSITTIEGLASDGKLHPVQEAFIAHDALQCGFCTPGLVMTCVALLERDPFRLKRTSRRRSADTSAVAARIRMSLTPCSPPRRRGEADGRARTDSTRLETLPSGVVGVAIGQVERAVPADEAPPLAPNAELRRIGKPTPRWNGEQKVTGAARYTADVVLPGMLHARLLRAPLPHARIRALDVRAAERAPGVRAVHVIVGPHGGGAASASADEDVQATRRVDDAVARLRRHGGGGGRRGVAGGGGRSDATDQGRLAADAVRRRHGRGAPRRRARRIPKARDFGWRPGGRPGSGRSAAEGQRARPGDDARGDAAAGLAAAEVVVDGEYRTQVQTHCCLEPHGIVADWRADGLTVILVHPIHRRRARDELARAFGLPLSRVRVVVEAMGGGFGSKSPLGTYGLAAVALSRKAQSAGAADARSPRGADRFGRTARRPGNGCASARAATARLTAISSLSYGSAGVALGAGVGNVASRLYTCPNFDETHFDVFINAGPGCAMRGSGRGAGRVRARTGDRRTGGEARPGSRSRCAIGSIQARCAVRSGASGRSASVGVVATPPGAEPGPIKTGLGMAQSLWGANVQVDVACEVRLLRDGSVEVRSSVQDIGTGTGTILAQVVAEELGLAPEDVDRAHRRHRISRRPAVGRQPHHGLDHAAGAQRGLQDLPAALFALAASGLGARAGGSAKRATAASPRARDPSRVDDLARGGGEDAHRAARALASRGDDYAGFRAPRGRLGGGAQRPRRRAVRRGRRGYRDRTGARRAGGRRPRLRPADQPGADRKPGPRRRAAGPRLRPAGAARHSTGKPGRIVNADLEAVQASRRVRSAADRRAVCSRTIRASARPTLTASPSRRTSPPRRRSPTPSTTRSACGCAPCR